MHNQGQGRESDLSKVTQQLHRRAGARTQVSRLLVLRLQASREPAPPLPTRTGPGCSSRPSSGKRGPAGSPGCQGQPMAASALEQRAVSIPLSRVRPRLRRPGSGKARAGLAPTARVHHDMPRAHPSPGEGRRGEPTRCPNIWTSQRAKMHHPDVFKAPCRVSAESRHLGGG